MSIFINRYLLFLGCYLISWSIFAQSNRVDSLQNILANHSREDTTKANLLVSLAYSYQLFSPDTAFTISQEAYLLSVNLNYKAGQASALHQMGNLMWLKANYLSAMDYAFQSLHLFEEIENKAGIANCYNLIANTYSMEKNYSKSLEYYEKSIGIYQSLRNKAEIGRAYANIGRTYYLQGRYDQAINQLQKAFDILAKVQEKNFYAAALNTAGDVQQKLGNDQKALDYYFQSLSITERLGMKRLISYSTRGISEVYQKQGKIKESNEYAQKTYQISKEVGYRENVKNAAFILSANYERLKQHEKSLAFYIIGSIQKDSMFSAEKEKQIEKLRTTYELGKKQKEISLLMIEQQLQRQKNNVLLLGIIIVLLILLIFYLNLQWLKKDKKLLLAQQQELSQQKEEIRAINDHLETTVADRTYELNLTVESLTKQNQDLQHFSYIVSHNLRAPVARIQGLVNIFNQENMNDEFNKQILNYLHTSSYDLDEVIRDLTNILSINKTMLVKERINLNEIITMELGYLDEQIKASKAQINIDFSKIHTIYTVKVYIQSIIHNLLSNAIKYHSPKRTPHIEVKSEIENNFIRLSFKDNGLGVNSEDLYKIFGLYQRMHTHVEGKGLGLYLVKSQVEAINGSIELESKLDEGSTFKVHLPYT